MHAEVAAMNEEAADRILQGLLADVPQLDRSRSALIRRAHVPRSAAESDSQRPLGHHVPSQCLAALGVAIDHLEAWADLWIRGRQHPLFAHITLVQGAIEGAVRCLWILDPDASEREALMSRPVECDGVDPEEALGWLASLGKLWRDTSDEGRRHLAVATFARLGVVSGPTRGSHRIVSVEATEEAERRGLVLALPASIEVTMVGDTGLEPVTSRM